MGQSRFQLLFLMVCIICSATIGFGFTCKEVERNALVKLKHSFMDSMNLLGSWVGEDCCNWKGVGCDRHTSNVVKLDFGSLYYLAAGEVNPALLELKYLKYLDLSFINFNLSRIPQFLGSMSQLQHLNLSRSFFSGEVPQNLGNLTKLVSLDLSHSGTNSNSLEWASKLENLQHLDLSGNNLSQTVETLNVLLHKPPPSLLVLKLANCQVRNSHQVIRNFNSSSVPLQHLKLSYNSFSGQFPSFIQNLSSIEFLDLSFNEFDSSIPSWLTNKNYLKHLELEGNSFNGPFPQFLKNSSLLTHVDLSNNHFSFSVPSWLANKTDLEYLDLRNNQFDRIDGGVINTMRRLCSLEYFDLSHNLFHEEVLESQINNFSSCVEYDLEFLSIKNNNFSGHLPIMEHFSYLQFLDLSHNSLQTIPSFLGSFSSLYYLDLSHNQLSVIELHVNLANLSRLFTLDISSNSMVINVSPDWIPPFQLTFLYTITCKLNGPFPKWLLSQEKIYSLDLSDTGISGPLPNDIGNKMKSLWSLRLANNHINGSIPRSLCELVKLGFLDLQNNWLSGMIPNCWENSQIRDMELSSNRLSGPIPNSVTKVNTLKSLSLSDNSLEGDLPKFSSNFWSLAVLDVGKNYLHGEIPPWNGANFPYLQILILRENRFKGVIPPQLCSVHALQIIDLAKNDLVGTIPRCFGQFEGMGFVQHSSDFIAPPPSSTDSKGTSDIASEPMVNPDEWSAAEVIKGEERVYNRILYLLVNMDLSCNNLVGVIPAQFTSLSLLIGLNLSHNHLTGAIPMEIGKMKRLESLDLSSNNLSGSIPESVSYLTFLSSMNLSFNNLHGPIPIGHQLQVLDDPSIYWGNPGLCGDPLPNKCFGYGIALTPTVVVNFKDEEEEEDKHEKMLFYMVIMLGFASGFWTVIGILVVKRRWRHAYFGLAEEIGDWVYVKVALGMTRAREGR